MEKIFQSHITVKNPYDETITINVLIFIFPLKNKFFKLSEFFICYFLIKLKII